MLALVYELQRSAAHMANCMLVEMNRREMHIPARTKVSLLILANNLFLSCEMIKLNAWAKFHDKSYVCRWCSILLQVYLNILCAFFIVVFYHVLLTLELSDACFK